MLFSGMTLKAVNKRWHIQSPYLPDDAYCPLDDELSLLDDGRFILQGRADRIVKIEEKRISLTELEQRLCESPFVSEVVTQALHKTRTVIAAVIVLSQDGLDCQETKGRGELIKQLRKGLGQWFEPVALPRKWLFVERDTANGTRQN